MLHTAAALDPQRVQMAVCCLRHERDELFDFDRRARPSAWTIARYCIPVPLTARVLARLSDIVAEFGPDILHSHDYKASFFATRLARRLKVHQCRHGPRLDGTQASASAVSTIRPTNCNCGAFPP